MEHKKIIDIKNYLFENFDIEIVIIQIGGWYEIIEEGADIMNSEFGLKLIEEGRPYRHVRFHFNGFNKYVDLINKLNYSYCFVLETDRKDNIVIRKVDISSDSEILELEFYHKISFKTNENPDTNILESPSLNREIIEEESNDLITDEIVDCITNILIELKDLSILKYVLSKHHKEEKLKKFINYNENKYYLPFDALQKISKLNTSLTVRNITEILITIDKKVEAKSKADADKKAKFEKYKTDYEIFKSYFNSINLNEVFHFTDRKNLDSIKKLGLISKKKLDEGGIKYKSTHEGYRKILNYVSLSLTDNNPMIYSALKENRITNPIIIRIDSEVLYLKYTIFYTSYSNALNSEKGSSFNFFRSKIIHRDVNSDSDIDVRKQEILVPEEIDVKYIKGFYSWRY